jgi:hypothetical protein
MPTQIPNIPNGGQCFDPKLGPPVMPEKFVDFYVSFIPFKCAGFPEREKAAFAALEERDQYAVERAMNGEPDDRTWLPPKEQWRRVF